MPLRTILFAAALALAAACGSRSSGRLAVSAAVTAAAGPATGALALGNGITVDRVRIVVRKIELEGSPAPSPAPAPAALSGPGRSGSSGDDDTDEDGEEEDEVEVGPFLVDLSGTELTSAITRVFDAEVPAGTYREISIDVRPVTAEKTGGDPAFDAVVAAGASVIVDGTVDDRPFSFTSALRARQKRESTLVVGAGSSNVTLSVDPTGWFQAGAARLDPTAAADRAAIEANVAASIDVFGDEDEDGHDDDGPGHD